MKSRHARFWQSRMFNAIESTVKSRVVRLSVISPENSDKSIVRAVVDPSLFNADSSRSIIGLTMIRPISG